MVPPSAGLGLKPQHYVQAHACAAADLWFEVHPENYMMAGGPRLGWLEAIRRDKPVSLHGVGLSLAGSDRPDRDHLARLKALVDRFQPFLMSEHLAWSRHGAIWNPDLLPFPRTRALLDRLADHVDEAQAVLGRRLLIENPSAYMDFNGHELDEPGFLVELADRTGCGLLIDVNNIFVSARNLDLDAGAWLDRIPAELIGEIHVAGHGPDPVLGEALLIDTHAAPVAEAVWSLLARLAGRIGPRPTLVERDADVPPFDDLMAERNRAVAILAEAAARESIHA